MSEESRPSRVCTRCGNESLIRDYEMGELICQKCGFVVETHFIDHGPEWRAFTQDQRDRRTRVGAPLIDSIHDRGLATVIDWHDKDAYGHRLSPVQRALSFRLRKWQRRSRVSTAIERNLAYVLSGISKIVSSLGLPKNVAEMASNIYRRALTNYAIKGKSTRGMAEASIYLVCRRSGIAKTLGEIANVTTTTKKEIGRSYRYLLRCLDFNMEPANPIVYSTKFANQLALSGNTELLASKLIDVAKRLRLTSGKGPAGIAAATTYIASILNNERRTQREVADAADVTEVTIRNRYRELTERLNVYISL